MNHSRLVEFIYYLITNLFLYRDLLLSKLSCSVLSGSFFYLDMRDTQLLFVFINGCFLFNGSSSSPFQSLLKWLHCVYILSTLFGKSIILTIFDILK